MSNPFEGQLHGPVSGNHRRITQQFTRFFNADVNTAGADLKQLRLWRLGPAVDDRFVHLEQMLHAPAKGWKTIKALARQPTKRVRLQELLAERLAFIGSSQTGHAPVPGARPAQKTPVPWLGRLRAAISSIAHFNFGAQFPGEETIE